MIYNNILYEPDLTNGTLLCNKNHFGQKNGFTYLKNSSIKYLKNYNLITINSDLIVKGKSHSEIGGIPILHWTNDNIITFQCMEGYEYIVGFQTDPFDMVQKYNQPYTTDEYDSFIPYMLPDNINYIDFQENDILFVIKRKFGIINKISTKKYLNNLIKNTSNGRTN